MLVDFPHIPSIGQKHYDDAFYEKIRDLPGLDASDLLHVYKSTGIGDYCNRVSLFSPGFTHPIEKGTFVYEDGELQGEAWIVGIECDGPCISVASDGEATFFQVVVWAQQIAYRCPSLELALVKLAELSGLVGLYKQPFFLSKGAFAYSFDVSLDYELNVKKIVSLIAGRKKIWTYNDTQNKEEWTVVCDGSEQLLVQIGERKTRNVSVYFNSLQPQVAKTFYERWMEGFNREGLEQPVRAI